MDKVAGGNWKASNFALQRAKFWSGETKVICWMDKISTGKEGERSMISLFLSSRCRMR
jgi:hypothetical protein